MIADLDIRIYRSNVKVKVTHDVLSFVERSESGADSSDVWPRPVVLSPAVCDEADEALVVSTCPVSGQSVVSWGWRWRRWWSCVLTGGS